MTELKILHTKDCMGKLLAGNVFDIFMLEEASVETFNTFSIDGHIHKAFYTDEDELPVHSLSDWAEIKPLVFDLIRGKHTPLSFRFILHLFPEKISEVLEGSDADPGIVASLALRISFKDGTLMLTTGSSLSVFSLDKSHEKAWDNYIKRFLSDNGIDFEEL